MLLGCGLVGTDYQPEKNEARWERLRAEWQCNFRNMRIRRI